MNLLKYVVVSLIALPLLLGCQDDDTPPNYPDEPAIALESVRMARAEGTRVFDSLIVVISYQDGDSDLGTSSANNNAPFIYLPNPRTGEEYWLYNSQDPEMPPYHCSDYQVIDFTPTDNVGTFDTVRAEFNPNYYNFRLTIWVKEGEEYQAYDPSDTYPSPYCSFPLGGRFPVIEPDEDGDAIHALRWRNSPFDYHRINQWEGRITYSIAYHLQPLFRNDSLKVSVSIRDEALHRSNTVFSEPFTL